MVAQKSKYLLTACEDYRESRMPVQRKHWQALKQAESQIELMEPVDFIRRWNIKIDDFARLCNCSRSTANRCLNDGNYIVPIHIRKHLAIVHKLWSKV